jgi:hypothetical protein
MCEGRERKEGKPGEENETVNPRGEVEAGSDQVQQKGPLRREFSNIIRITTTGGSCFGRSSGESSSPGHQSFCQQK